MVKVSVVIPVYNVEKYLPACLDSVLGQSLREIECICIDDASPDHCGEILDEYAARDSRIRVLHLTENNMQGYARNLGTKLAQGEYVYFLDSDDMITPTALEELYQLAKQDDLDGVFFDSQVIFESEGLSHYASSYPSCRHGEYPDEVITGIALLDIFVQNGEWLVFVQREFWRRDYLLENDIFSPEKTEHEDELFSFQAIALAQRVRYIKREYFIHRFRENSVMTRKPHPKDFHGYFTIFCQMIEFANDHQLSSSGIKWNIVHMYENALRFINTFDKKENPDNWFLPEEQKNYRLFLEIISCQEMIKARDNMFWLPVKAFNEIWIYGAGRVARQVFVRLQNCNTRIAGFLVTDAVKNPETLFDLPVYSINTVDALPKGAVVVVAMAAALHDGPSDVLTEKGFPFFLYSNNTLAGPFGHVGDGLE